MPLRNQTLRNTTFTNGSRTVRGDERRLTLGPLPQAPRHREPVDHRQK